MDNRRPRRREPASGRTPLVTAEKPPFRSSHKRSEKPTTEFPPKHHQLQLRLGTLPRSALLHRHHYLLLLRCTRPTTPNRDFSTDSDSDTPSTAAEQQLGLDEATLLNFPQLLYSQAKLHQHHGSSAASGCSICLAEYKDADVLRLLPECGHLFHLSALTRG
ncbi:hypothetical protein C3L33_16848, partial [Rhododendron williamsianum]